MAVQNETRGSTPQPPRRPRVEFLSRQPRSRLMKSDISRPATGPQRSSLLVRINRTTREGDIEKVEPKRQLSLRLSLCNTVLGTVGFISALCFGVIAIVQADTANKQAKVANKIAGKSLLLSWVQTCAQVVDISASCQFIFTIPANY